MGRFTYGLIAIAVLVIGATVLFISPLIKFPDLSLEHLSSPYVKVLRIASEVTAGHGSDTHIGGGFILTANHVLGVKAKYEVLGDKGQKYPAEVVARNIELDTAVLRVVDPQFRVAAVSCRDTLIGEPVTATGNPIDLEFVSFWGRVSGAPRSMTLDDIDIKSAIVVDMTIAPGVSGAGVRDAEGKIIGLVSGSSYTRGVPLPISFIIPSSVFCPILKDVGAV